MNSTTTVQVKEIAPEDGGGFHAFYPELGEFTVYGISDESADAAIADLLLNYADYIRGPKVANSRGLDSKVRKTCAKIDEKEQSELRN